MARRGRGEGTIRRRSDSRWEAIIDVGLDENGRRRRRSIYGKTRGEVAERLAAALHAQDRGTLADARGETLGAFLMRWLGEVAVRDSTRRHYRQKLELHVIPAIGRIPLAKLTPEHVNTLLQSELRAGLSPRTVSHVRAILRNALGRAVRWGMVSRNVAELADPPRVPEYEARFLSVDEARAFLAAAAGDRLAALYSVALSLGLRQGEALGLRWDDVDLDARTLRVAHALDRVPGRGLQLVEPKTRSSRRALVLPDVVVRALRTHRARQLEERLAAGARWQDLGFVFTTYEGRPLGASHVVADSFRPIVRRAGLSGRLRFHDLRHSAATLLLAQGVPQRVVMEQLGHTTLAMTQKYTHVVPQLMNDAAAAMDRALGAGVSS
jgi:integrase